ncbi:hypothetical protein E0494_01875 [Marinilabiliaceae bacterium JC040]|nr:hypothetical protein [Marinilabiliaceae bacterium JC040]
MKNIKITIILILGIISLNAKAQNTYQQTMGSGMQEWSKGNNIKAIAIFERVSQVEKKEWIPPYYVALVNIFDSFSCKSQTLINQKIIKAEKYISISKQRNANRAEIKCAEGLINTLKIIQNPMENGKKYSKSIINSYTEALELEPKNPRALYLLSQFQINTASFTGAKTDKFYKQLEKAIDLFNKFKSKEAFYPNWGKQQAVQVLKNRDNAKKDK